MPVLGGVAIGIWVKYTTTEIDENSAVILSQKLHVQETDKVDDFEQDEEEKLDVLENKVLILMNLMKVDGIFKDKEKVYIKQIIDNIDFSFFTNSKFKVDCN